VYTDTHCHLALVDGDEPVEDVVGRARAAGVTTLVTVGIDLASSAEAVHVATAFREVWAAVGIHPHNAIEATEHVLGRLRAVANHPQVVAIGETGLDYFREHSPRIRQEESFREHIRIAKDLGKALVIHCRDAHADVVDILLDERAPERTVFHCFSGDTDLVQVCAAHGWYMSFAGNVTFKNTPHLRAAAAAAPAGLLVTETDSPYLSPHPYRGQPNEPARIPLIVEQLAALQGVPVEDMARHTTANARRLFALDADAGGL
jgi:TatD DNase family protein